jgi:hypothetical protein
LGHLALRHAEFYRLTPQEFHDLCEGFRTRLRSQEDREAKWVAALMNVHTKKKVRPEELLGRPLGPPVKRKPPAQE